jgi:hypothetical protein
LSITLAMATPVPPGGLVHPILTVPISVAARWSGCITLHAGAYEVGGTAWAVLGEREAGKSSLLASLATRAACPVVADDLLVIDDGAVLAGPNCVDLRPDVVGQYPGARPVGEIGGRLRHRLSTPPSLERSSLGGILSLGWHGDAGIKVEKLPAAEALRLIYAQEYIALLGPADPVKILDLLGVPAYRVLRPRDWGVVDELCERLVALAGDQD